MKRTLHELREYALSLVDDIEFTWNGIHGLIVPYNRQKFILTVNDPDGLSEEFHDIDELLTARLLDGHSLAEVCEKADFWR